MKSGIIENVLSWAKFKQSKDLKKNDGKKKTRLAGIPKLDDANHAGNVYGRKEFFVFRVSCLRLCLCVFVFVFVRGDCVQTLHVCYVVC